MMSQHVFICVPGHEFLLFFFSPIAVDSKIFHFFKSWKGQRMDALHFPRISACLGLGSASLSWEAQFSNDL